MTPDDTPGAERETSRRRSEAHGRYVAYETDDGAFVIRDESNPDAWLRSDTVVAIPVDEA